MVREIMALGILAATEAVRQAIARGDVREACALETLEIGTSAAAMQAERIVGELLCSRIAEHEIEAK